MSESPRLSEREVHRWRIRDHHIFGLGVEMVGSPDIWGIVDLIFMSPDKSIAPTDFGLGDVVDAAVQGYTPSGQLRLTMLPADLRLARALAGLSDRALTPRQVRCEIIGWVDDGPQPGVVEARLVDAHGRAWLFHEKEAVIAPGLTAQTHYPVDTTIACEVWDSRPTDEGGSVIEISTERPWGVTSVEQQTVFEITPDQLLPPIHPGT